MSVLLPLLGLLMALALFGVLIAAGFRRIHGRSRPSAPAGGQHTLASHGLKTARTGDQFVGQRLGIVAGVFLQP